MEEDEDLYEILFDSHGYKYWRDKMTLECTYEDPGKKPPAPWVRHDLNTANSTPVKSPSEILKLDKDCEVIAIDEAQFFSDDLIDVCNKLANQGKRVIISGLDMDFLGKPFGVIPKILAIAEHVTKVHAICANCCEIANYSFRLSKNTELVKLGQKDEYKPLCRQCFVKNI